MDAALPADQWLCELEMEDPSKFIDQCGGVTSPTYSIFDDDDEYGFQSAALLLSPESYRSSLMNAMMIDSASSPSPCNKKTITANDTGTSSSPDGGHLQGGGSGDHQGSDDCSNRSDSLVLHCGKKMLSSSSTTTEQPERVEEIHSLSSSRPPVLQAKNHVVAERKRRERLNQKLIALSALIPGLKKMDKASILEEATKYIKLLQERVKTLEAKQPAGEAKASRSSTRLVSLGKRSRVPVRSNRNRDEADGDEHGDDDDTSTTSSDNDNSDANKHLPPPPPQHPPDHGIDLRVSDKHVLLRINSKKQDGVIVAKILREIDKFCLHVSSSSILPFGDTALEITIIAQMGDEFRMKVEDHVKNLRSAILKLF